MIQTTLYMIYIYIITCTYVIKNKRITHRNTVSKVHESIHHMTMSSSRLGILSHQKGGTGDVQRLLIGFIPGLEAGLGAKNIGFSHPFLDFYLVKHQIKVNKTLSCIQPHLCGVWEVQPESADICLKAINFTSENCCKANLKGNFFPISLA